MNCVARSLDRTSAAPIRQAFSSCTLVKGAALPPVAIFKNSHTQNTQKTQNTPKPLISGGLRTFCNIHKTTQKSFLCTRNYPISKYSKAEGTVLALRLALYTLYDAITNAPSICRNRHRPCGRQTRFAVVCSHICIVAVCLIVVDTDIDRCRICCVQRDCDPTGRSAGRSCAGNLRTPCIIPADRSGRAAYLHFAPLRKHTHNHISFIWPPIIF